MENVSPFPLRTEWQEKTMQSRDRCQAKSHDWTDIPQTTQVWMMMLRKKTAPWLEEAEQVVSLPDVDDGKRQSAWADLLHGELCRLQPHRHIQWAQGPRPPARDTGNLKRKQSHSAVPSRANQSPLIQWWLSPILRWQVKPPKVD